MGTLDQERNRAAVLLVNLAATGASADAMHRIDADAGTVSGSTPVSVPPLSVAVVELIKP